MKTLLSICLIGLLSLPFAEPASAQNPFKKAGDAVKDAGKKTGEVTGDAVKTTGEVTKDAVTPKKY